MTKVGEVRERAAVLQAMFEATGQKLRKALELLTSREGVAMVERLEGAALLVADAEALLLSAYADEVAALTDELERLRAEVEKRGGSDGNAVG